MPYVSKAYQVAEAIRLALSDQVWGEPYEAWLATVEESKRYAVKQIPLIGQDQRKSIGRLRFFVCPRNLTTGLKDRCGTKWNRQLTIAVVGACQTVDITDKTQPVGLDELDQYMKLTESVAEYLDANRTIGSHTLVGEIEASLVNDDALRMAQIYLGFVVLEYR